MGSAIRGAYTNPLTGVTEWINLKATEEGYLLIADSSSLGGGSGGGSGTTAVDRELAVSTYVCKTAFPGASIGDTIIAIHILDVTTSPTVVGTIWRNLTTAADLASAPSFANLELQGSGALTNAQLRATPVPVSVSGVATETTLSALNTKVPNQQIPGMIPVDVLATLSSAKSVAIGATSANVALAAGTRRVSIHATVAAFYAVGTGAQTATTSTHYIGAGERLDFDVAANSQIAAIRAVAVDGTLYISELT